MKAEPKIQVGIMARKDIRFLLFEAYSCDGETFGSGLYEASVKNNQVCLKNDSGEKTKESFTIVPDHINAAFELKDVTIGIGFHWEQFENQKFRGTLKLVPEGDQVRVINVIGMEEYLQSVISSEMSATSSDELLKAHSVISRSWILAQMSKNQDENQQSDPETIGSQEEIIRWYDREDHKNFDVCADDHCQRYQGIKKISSENAIESVRQTIGEVLWSEGRICDTRFSKCCGGISENYENIWQPVRYSYLTKVVDSAYGDTTCVDLRREDEAAEWIRNEPDAFCNTKDDSILRQVLPDFDQATTDFYRWQVSYRQKELSALIKTKSGIDFGEIIKLEPLERGHSSRIVKLKIHGTKNTVTVGKELEIRKWLSKSHLYSSAFVVEHLNHMNGVPQKIKLTGAGWGHGVGLCQIGAAVMGEKGYSYQDILSHYFRGATLKKLY